MNANVTSAPFFLRQEITGFAADRPCSDNDDFLPAFFSPDSTSRQFKHIFSADTGNGRGPGVEPTATMTASERNFCTASGVASLFKRHLNAGLRQLDFEIGQEVPQNPVCPEE